MNVQHFSSTTSIIVTIVEIIVPLFFLNEFISFAIIRISQWDIQEISTIYSLSSIPHP